MSILETSSGLPEWFIVLLATTSNNLQRKLANKLKEIRQDKNIFVKADKTTISNHYKTEPKEYMTLVHKNVTKGYKKAGRNVPYAITSVDKKVT